MHLSIYSAISLLLISFIVLSLAAHLLIAGASSLATKSGLSPLIIGLTIVAFGTSVPEVIIAILSSLHKVPAFALGGAVGSNICNISLVLGATAMLIPLKIRSKIVARELPILFLSMALLTLLMIGGTLSRWNGWVLLICAFLVVLWLIREGLQKRKRRDVLAKEYKKEIHKKVSVYKAVSQITFGLALLLASSHLIVESGYYIATYFKVSHLIIGLTIFALGTSLPELATSIIGARKKEYDIVVGNIIGSNIFNTLAVIGIAAVIHPIPLNKSVIWNVIIMFGLSFLFCIFAFRQREKDILTRTEGGILLGLYIGYLIFLIFIG